MVLASACGPPVIDSTNDVAGEYSYTYPSGQIEVLYIAQDKTFVQQFYANEGAAGRSAPPRSTTTGTWSYSGRELTFHRLLSFCDFPDVNSMRATPEPVTAMNLVWIAPTGDQDARISVFDDAGYVFRRVGTAQRPDP